MSNQTSGAIAAALGMQIAQWFAERYRKAIGRPPPMQASAWSASWPEAARWFLDAAEMSEGRESAEQIAQRALDAFFADPWVRSNRYPVRAFVDHPDRYAPEPEAHSLEREAADLAAELPKLREAWGAAKERGDAEAKDRIRARVQQVNDRIAEIGRALPAPASPVAKAGT